MSKYLVIVGAGNVGGFISYNIQEFGDYEVIGFLDDDPQKHGKVIYNAKVLGNVEHLTSLIKSYADLSVVIGIANPKAKQAISVTLRNHGIDFPSLVSKNAWISNEVSIGDGCIIYPGVSVNYECSIGDFVIMNMNCALGHNCTIADYSTLAPSVSLAGFSRLEKGVDMGINSATIQKVRIGEYSRIGGMAMLIKDVPPNCTAVGNPGRIIKQSSI